MNKFPVEMTHNHNFRLNEREVVKVSMMQTKGNFLAANDQELDCDILQLEYVGGISMLIVIPRKLSGMKTLEAQLTPQVVERWQKSMTNRYFRSSVPLLSRAGVSSSKADLCLSSPSPLPYPFLSPLVILE